MNTNIRFPRRMRSMKTKCKGRGFVIDGINAYLSRRIHGAAEKTHLFGKLIKSKSWSSFCQ
jgi:hypothetical protein